jgi:hypothetical protein
VSSVKPGSAMSGFSKKDCMVNEDIYGGKILQYELG